MLSCEGKLTYSSSTRMPVNDGMHRSELYRYATRRAFTDKSVASLEALLWRLGGLEVTP